METIEFILIIATFAVVLFWYMQNIERGAEAVLGLLALAEDPSASNAQNEKRSSYRMKDRPMRNRASMRDVRAEKAHRVAYRMKDNAEADRNERLRQRFRRQDEARYKVKDKAAAYTPQKKPKQ